MRCRKISNINIIARKITEGVTLVELNAARNKNIFVADRVTLYNLYLCRKIDALQVARKLILTIALPQGSHDNQLRLLW